MKAEQFEKLLDNLDHVDMNSWNWQYNAFQRKYYVSDYYDEISSGDIIIELHSINCIRNREEYVEDLEFEIDDFIIDEYNQEVKFTKEQFEILSQAIEQQIW